MPAKKAAAKKSAAKKATAKQAKPTQAPAAYPGPDSGRDKPAEVDPISGLATATHPGSTVVKPGRKPQ